MVKILVQKMSTQFSEPIYTFYIDLMKQDCEAKMVREWWQFQRDLTSWDVSGQKLEEIWKQSCSIRSWPLFISSPRNMSHSIRSREPFSANLSKSLTTQRQAIPSAIPSNTKQYQAIPSAMPSNTKQYHSIRSLAHSRPTRAKVCWPLRDQPPPPPSLDSISWFWTYSFKEDLPMNPDRFDPWDPMRNPCPWLAKVTRISGPFSIIINLLFVRP